MKRRLSNLATAVSLVLFIANAVLSVRSYWICDELERIHVYRDADGVWWLDKPAISWVRGRYLLLQRLVRFHSANDANVRGSVQNPDREDDQWKWAHGPATATFSNDNLLNVLGFDRWSHPNLSVGNGTLVYRGVMVPCWFVQLLTALLPAWWLIRRWRSHRRTQAGLCRVCGYDLRATPDRCPECGTAAEAAR